MAKNKGVTLIELLIVIIVFIIVFISLTPLVNRMRNRANMIKCSNNIRLISLALHMYAAKHDGDFPPGLKSLYPDYIKEEAAFRCPANGHRAGGVEQPDYEYMAGLTESSPPTEVIVYDRKNNHKEKGRNILRVDGSVGWVQSTEGPPH